VQALVAEHMHFSPRPQTTCRGRRSDTDFVVVVCVSILRDQRFGPLSRHAASSPAPRGPHPCQHTVPSLRVTA